VAGLSRKSDMVGGIDLPASKLEGSSTNRLSGGMDKRFASIQVSERDSPCGVQRFTAPCTRRMVHFQAETEIRRPRFHSIRAQRCPRKRSQPHKAKLGPLPADFFSETHPAHKIPLVYTQGDSPCNHSFHGAAFEVIPIGTVQKIHKQQNNSDQTIIACSTADIAARNQDFS
jgi:hypothetical protein